MSGRKSLSGATMGMRFMQRKTPSKSEPEETADQDMQSPSPMKPLHSIENEDADPSIPIMASSSDMYGISAEIIGRRSFNDFHKSVEETWIQAVQSRSRSKFESKVERQQITDEELLERYEKYVKGKGDMIDKKERSIGNLTKKKRKRN